MCYDKLMSALSAEPFPLEVLPEQEVSQEAVGVLATYIVECQLPVVPTAEDYKPWTYAWQLQWECNVLNEVEFNRSQGVRLLVLATQKAYEALSMERDGPVGSLQIPEEFFALSDETWQYLEVYFVARPSQSSS